jgi:multiple sugar transport system substrate-binding protein
MRGWCHTRLVAIAAFSCVLVLAAGPAATNQLTINSNASDPAPRAAWEAIVGQFAKANPDISVTLNVFDHESYKRAIRNWLTSASPDVVFWFAGNRMRQFARPGLLEDVSSLFSDAVREHFDPHTIDLVSLDDRQFGIPYAYYHIGIFYRSDLFQSAGISAPPRTWDELKDACRALKRIGVTAFAIGTKDLWPTAAWFDYLNLRINGIEFHRSLTDGEIRYTDDRLTPVFEAWRELIEGDCFTKSHSAMSWQESQALIYSGRAAMILIGSFIVPHFPAGMRERMAFFPFPSVKHGVPQYEEAPMNSVHIPARARNHDNARNFLQFLLTPEVQQSLAEALGQIPANRSAAIKGSRFLKQGRALIESAAGLTQYFDRDTNEELAAIAMKGFQEFMLHPGRLVEILANIERARLRVMKN